MNFTGSFFDLLNPYALLGGVTSLALFTLHGALFLTLKAEGEVRARARHRHAGGSGDGAPAGLTLAATYLGTNIFAEAGVLPGLVPTLARAALLITGGWHASGMTVGRSP